MKQSIELNLDGLVGPTHNYSGLSYGNTASMEHGLSISNPKKAALQGLEKMRLLHSLGVVQAVLPPQERPFIPLLRNLGFYGTDEEILERAWKCGPKFLMACSSSASMWAANAATISPSADSNDSRLHLTPANLISKFHRSFEASSTGLVLYRIFNHPAYFAHHPPLPYHSDFADEGAANHTRFCSSFDKPGIQFFVFGRATAPSALPERFPPRQTEEASRAISRLHRLNPQRTFFAQQNPDAIDAGVFHNDVISVGNQNVFLYHERAFLQTYQVVQELKRLVETHCQIPFIPIKVKESEIRLQDAVQTYLFNSQIVTLPDQTMALLAPQECSQSPSASLFLKRMQEDLGQPIRKVLFQDIRESMQNGGGPACLRLRIVLTPTEFEAMNRSVILTEDLYHKLVAWVEKHYRDRLTSEELSDPQLLKESRRALDELTGILQLGPIYPFQRSGPPPQLPEKRS